MKTIKRRIIATLLSLILAGIVCLGQTAEELLPKAMQLEEVKGELEEAIIIYETIVNDFSNNREYAAKAQLHIGMCYEKIGKKQAAEAYNKVIEQFADQQQSADIAKKRLQYLNALALDIERTEELKGGARVMAELIYPDPHMTGDITPDGKFVSDVDWTQGNMRINNIETGEKILITDEGSWRKPNKFGDHSVYSHDGKYLAYYWIIGDGAQLRIHNFETGKYNILVESSKVKSCPWPMEWSKDGKYLLTTASLGASATDGVIQLVSVSDGSTHDVTIIEECPCGGASLSPDGKYVAIAIGDEADDRDIHLVAVDGSLDYKLIGFPGADWAPKWTPDGEKLIFASERSGHPALWSVKIKNGQKIAEPELIYENVSENHFSMRFTDDGKYVYSSGSAYSNVFTTSINAAKGTVDEPVSIMDDYVGVYSSPFWSPDGRKLAYVVSEPQNWENGNYILIQDLETGEKKRVNPGLKNLETNRMWASPQWSDDGKNLLLRYQKERNESELVLLNIETENKTYLKGHEWNIFGPENSILYVNRDLNKIIQQDIRTQKEKVIYESDQQIFHLAISKDKSLLAFFVGEMGTGRTQQKLFVMTLDDKKAKLMWEVGENQFFTWNAGLYFFPDGKTLFLALSKRDTIESEVKSRQFYTFNTETLEKKKLGPEFENPVPSFEHFRLSPDGKTVAFSRMKQMSNIWSLEFDF